MPNVALWAAASPGSAMPQTVQSAAVIFAFVTPLLVMGVLSPAAGRDFGPGACTNRHAACVERCVIVRYPDGGSYQCIARTCDRQYDNCVGSPGGDSSGGSTPKGPKPKGAADLSLGAKPRSAASSGPVLHSQPKPPLTGNSPGTGTAGKPRGGALFQQKPALGGGGASLRRR